MAPKINPPNRRHRLGTWPTAESKIFGAAPSNDEFIESSSTEDIETKRDAHTVPAQTSSSSQVQVHFCILSKHRQQDNNSADNSLPARAHHYCTRTIINRPYTPPQTDFRGQKETTYWAALQALSQGPWVSRRPAFYAISACFSHFLGLSEAQQTPFCACSDRAWSAGVEGLLPRTSALPAASDPESITHASTISQFMCKYRVASTTGFEDLNDKTDRPSRIQKGVKTLLWSANGRHNPCTARCAATRNSRHLHDEATTPLANPVVSSSCFGINPLLAAASAHHSSSPAIPAGPSHSPPTKPVTATRPHPPHWPASALCPLTKTPDHLPCPSIALPSQYRSQSPPSPARPHSLPRPFHLLTIITTRHSTLERILFAVLAVHSLSHNTFAISTIPRSLMFIVA